MKRTIIPLGLPDATSEADRPPIVTRASRLQHHPHRPLAPLRGAPARFCHGPILSGSGASAKVGAVGLAYVQVSWLASLCQRARSTLGAVALPWPAEGWRLALASPIDYHRAERIRTSRSTTTARQGGRT